MAQLNLEAIFGRSRCALLLLDAELLLLIETLLTSLLTMDSLLSSLNGLDGSVMLLMEEMAFENVEVGSTVHHEDDGCAELLLSELEFGNFEGDDGIQSVAESTVFCQALFIQDGDGDDDCCTIVVVVLSVFNSSIFFCRG